RADRIVAMAKRHSSELFYGMDDPLEAAVFSVLIEIMKEQDLALEDLEAQLSVATAVDPGGKAGESSEKRGARSAEGCTKDPGYSVAKVHPDRPEHDTAAGRGNMCGSGAGGVASAGNPGTPGTRGKKQQDPEETAGESRDVDP
ncbi:MAG: hypothetical protein LUQ25_01550, partial [Methanoregulaceae archaeon]|nr:hypothetical protein [Methanoregulaceae archaeon]